MYFSKTHTDRHDSIYYMNTPIEFKQSTQLLGVHLTEDISDKSIASTVHKFYGKVNSVLYDFKNVPCHVKSKLLATYCLDLYGSQLWNYSSIDVQSFYVAWRKTIRRFGSYLILQIVRYYRPLMIAFQLKIFLNKDAQSLSGQALIVLTQL